MKKFLKRILPFTLVALIAVSALTGCGGDGGGTSPETQATTLADNAAEIGEGQTQFRFEAIDDAGETTAWNVSTDLTMVGAALLEVGLIEGDVEEYGLYVKVVNGLTADYDTEQSYWAFYVNGEYAVTGVDTTDIEPDKTYAFIYTKD